ncbi:UDP-Glc:alpha-D-GlcNAc-diphosphoundecaprenol beta-1,3-glucosyltransferase WfgD [bacterium BMS3Abin03]|nr:UDP-Glc:alpha-D-GlcNAc-diphosphoundecaprenol beta-1,3-glucosyltransferase WfgD [bacterium BMS3Abin03]
MISIILAAYNGSQYIREQLDSLLHQTCNDYEIIIIDDCSDDNTYEMVKNFFANINNKNVQLIRNEENLGPTKSFEKGIKLCNGKYIAFCDQDDVWMPNKLSVLLETIENEKSDLVFAQSYLLNSGRKTGKRYPPIRKAGNLFNQLLYNNARGATMLVRKDFIERILPFSPYDIYDKWIYFSALCSGKISFVNEPLDYYRIHSKNYVGNQFRFRKKENLLIRLNNSVLFYKDFQKLVSDKLRISSEKILNSVRQIILFYEQTINCLKNRKLRICLNNYFNYVLRNEFSIKEKLIYFYYMILKKQ